MKPVRTMQDVVERLQTNWQGYVRTYWPFLILVSLAAMADMLSTVYFMIVMGPDVERHPTVRLFSTLLGPVAGPIIGKLWQFAALLAVTVYLRRWARYIFVTVIFLYTWAAWYNIWGYHVYYPVLLHWIDRLTR